MAVSHITRFSLIFISGKLGILIKCGQKQMAVVVIGFQL